MTKEKKIIQGQNLYNDIYSINCNTKQEIATLLIRIFILMVMLALSVFCEIIIFLVVMYSVYLIAIAKKIEGINIIAFLIPLSPIISYKSLDFMSIFIVEFIIICCIKFCYDLFKKRKKVSKIRTILLLFILVLFASKINKLNFVGTCGIFSGLLIVYFISYYYAECEIYRPALSFILGVIASILIGLFRPISDKLASSIPVVYVAEKTRFSGVWNPNILAGQIVVAIGFLYYLILSKRIKFTFYPIYATFLLALIFTLSKAGLIIFSFISIIFLLLYIIFEFKKIKIAKGIIGVLLTIFLFCSTGSVTRVYLNRFSILANNKSEEIIIPDNSTNQEIIEPQPDVVKELTTGRSVLWKKYILKTFENPQTAFFGYGINALATEDDGSGVATNAHNTIIQILYYNGVVGLLLIASFLLSCIKYRNISKKWLFMTLPLGAIALFSLSESIYGYVFFCIISIILLGINQKEEEIKERLCIDTGENQNMKNFKIAVLTPTYNRENLLNDCYESLRNQTNKNFVWYVVDDGSTDKTEQVVKKFIKENKKNKDFEIAYLKKENGGKHTALNEGLKIIKEEYVIILDSDDSFVKEAIEIINIDLSKISSDETICGIGYLRKYKNNQVIGKSYERDGVIDTFINQRYNKNTFGDKSEVFKTNILKQFPFPQFEGEKFLSESTVWCRMSGEYKMLFRNESIYICEYQQNGLSDGVHKRLFKNPYGSVECYKELSTKEFRLTLRIKYTIAYIVYGLAAGMTLKQLKQKHKTNKLLITTLYLPAKVYFKKLQRKYK